MLRFILLFILPALLLNMQQKNYSQVEAFTHPLDIKNSVSIYSEPNKYYKELDSDIEAGWIVEIKQKDENYFKIDIVDLKLNDVWIHLGDLGVIVQNYDSFALPVYLGPDTNFSVKRYIYKSYVGLLYDVKDDMFFLQIVTENGCFFGWVERKYLCSNPYTTCG